MAARHTSQTAYDLPQNATENDRLNNQSDVMKKITGNKVVHAPLVVQNIHRMLDIGSGTGIVTREFASQFSHAHCIGVDLLNVPQSVDGNCKNGNVEFLKGDFMALSGLHAQLPNGTFDYCFSRYLVYAITDWYSYVSKAKELLRPGGWLEVQDASLTCHSWLTHEPANLEWEAVLHDTAREAGLAPDVGQKLSMLFKDVGLRNINVWEYKVPLGRGRDWGDEMEEVGQFYEATMPPLLEALMRKRLAGKFTENQVEEYIRQMKEDVTGRKGYYFRFYVVVGQT